MAFRSAGFSCRSHGGRARRGGVAREGEGAQFDSDPQERGSDCKFGCRAIALHAFQKKGFGLLRQHSEMGLLWVYWWASNYASPGLTVLRRRSPGPPAPAEAGTRGAIKN
jgi:hypothetical protein